MVDRIGLIREAFALVGQRRVESTEKFPVGITAPLFIKHRLMAGRADSSGHIVRPVNLAKNGRNIIFKFNPGECFGK